MSPVWETARIVAHRLLGPRLISEGIGKGARARLGDKAKLEEQESLPPEDNRILFDDRKI